MLTPNVKCLCTGTCHKLDPTAGTGSTMQAPVLTLPDWAKPTIVNDDICIDQPYDEFGFANHL